MILTAFHRQLIAISLLVALVLAIAFGVVLPFANGFAQRQAEREMLLNSIQRNQRLISAMPVFAKAAAGQKRSGGRFAILAANQPDAVERLRQRLSRLSVDAEASLANVEETESTAEQVRIRADLKVTYDQLYEILSRLQNEEPYVSIKYLSVSADRALETNRLDQMDVRLELSAD